MAFDSELADRIRELLDARDGLTEKRMFGGIAFLLNGNMAVAVSSKGGIMVRVDPERTEKLLSMRGAGPMIMNGRELAGWVRVDDDALNAKRDLARWVERGIERASALPPKAKGR